MAQEVKSPASYRRGTCSILGKTVWDTQGNSETGTGFL